MRESLGAAPKLVEGTVTAGKTTIGAAVISAPRGQRAARPLYVDMDGTLLATDILWELLIIVLKTKPAMLLRVPFWLLKGKAFLKHQLASRITLDPALLPYHQPVVTFLKDERKKGREIILATASDKTVADRVAHHVGLFTAVLASHDGVNLAGRDKLSAIRRHAGSNEFDYVGNSLADLPIWRQASGAMIVGASHRLLAKVEKTSTVTGVLCPRISLLKVLPRMLRVPQWCKNALLFAPLALAHKITDIERDFNALLAAIAFSLLASAVYILNDLIDLDNDRQHPQKRTRPLAAGRVPLSLAFAVIPLAILLSFGIAIMFLPRLFCGMLLLYLGATTAYSFIFKRKAILDVVLLASLYTLRVLAGAAAVSVPVSTWFLAFSMFLFVSLAFVKRYAELHMVHENPTHNGFLRARAYLPGDLDLLRSVGTASGYLAIAVFALYINSPEVHVLYHSPTVLWLIEPLLLYWITRVWFLSHRGQMHGDPVVFALTDRLSHIMAGLVAVLLLVASMH